MKACRVFYNIIIIIALLYNFTLPSVTQGVDREGIWDTFYLDDEAGEKAVATISVYDRGTSVSVDNHDPQLTQGQVEPESGDSLTQFYYSVDYYDQDGDVPATISVYIDDEPASMTLETGEAYQGIYISEAHTLTSGSHTYYFTATDEEGKSVRFPVSGYLLGPTVNDLPELSGGRVVPEEGTSSTDFYYYVEYQDEDGDSPATKYVYIDGVAYVMNLYSGKGSQGTYRYGPKLLKTGSHDFYFSFTDVYGGKVRLPPEGAYSGPDIAYGSLYIYDTIGGAAIILNDSDSGYRTPSILTPVDVGIQKVALLKDAFVSFPPYALVEVMETQTIDVPFILLPCPAAIALEDNADGLQRLRDFRDNQLNRTERGRAWVSFYYTYASEVSLLILSNEDVRVRVGRVVGQVIPLIYDLLAGEHVIFPHEVEEEIQLLCDDFEEKGSPFLKAAVRKVRSDLLRKELLKDMGFGIEKEVVSDE